MTVRTDARASIYRAGGRDGSESRQGEAAEVERAKGVTMRGERGFEHCNMATRIRAKSRETSGFDSLPGWKAHT